ncbi:MAG: TIGR02186 family protein, partial [Sphingomonas sp.]
EEPGRVSVREGVLYRARMRLPARVPVGAYTAETFLVQDGRVIAAQVREVTVQRRGFERIVAVFAQDWALGYGLGAVALSVLLGWAAGIAFGRKRG